MPTDQIAIVCIAGDVLVITAAAWSLAFFKGWKITVSTPGQKGAGKAKTAPRGKAEPDTAELPAIEPEPLRSAS